MRRAERPFREVNAKIGEHLRSLRLRRRMTQERVAQRIGVTYAQVQKYERGECSISVGAVLMFCQLYAVTPDQLLGFGHDS
jgi:transcriptional regulator with XRE-family HTH domain